MFTHVEQTNGGHNKLHISHLHRYVSAYVTNEETIKDLVRALEEALVLADKHTKTVIVDQDGEFCFHVCPSGLIRLMVPWREFKVLRD